jgi:hypothetical protein
MRTRRAAGSDLLITLSLLLVLVASGVLPVAAQAPHLPDRNRREPSLSAGGSAAVEKPAQTIPEDTGGPDTFGYTWSNAVPFGWIDATGGTDTGMSGSSWGQAVGPIPLPFSFKFYENAYEEVYIAAAGFLAFADGGYWPSQQNPMPSPTPPNDVIAPFWTIMDLEDSGPTGRVYYTSGGTAPSRTFVVEWFDVAGGSVYDASGGDELYRFEVILHENGDIVYQYHTMIYNDWRYYASTGIENWLGLDGLGYMDWDNYWSRLPGSGTALRFYHPAPAPRVGIWPPYQGSFTSAGQVTRYQVPIRNTGEMGADTFDLLPSSSWSLSLYAADGITPLSDTDSDGTVDTGLVAQGDTVTIVAKVVAPPIANAADHDPATIVARSSLDLGVMGTATLQTAVPVPFAQVYRDRADGAMSLYLGHPDVRIAIKTTPDETGGHDPAVAETPNGFAYFWTKLHRDGDMTIQEIEYTLVDSYGHTIRGLTKLTDHTGATVHTYDDIPAVAVAPDGRIGVLWYRELWDGVTGEYNFNIYLAILNASGNPVFGPASLTNNSVWGEWDAYDLPMFWSPAIAATGDNRFVLAWEREMQTLPGSLANIYTSVRNTSGAMVKPIAPFTADTPGIDEGYSESSLAPLSGNRALLLWERWSDGDIYYAVLDSAGAIVKGATNLSTGASGWSWGADAAQLGTGQTVVGWTGGSYPGYENYTAVLDEAYNRVAGPTSLINPAAPLGDGYVSVAPAANWAVLTWMDYFGAYRPNLYYAVVDGSGSILGSPVIFVTGAGPDPSLRVSYDGHSNTSYSLIEPTTEEVDTWVTAPAMAGGRPGGTAAAYASLGNYGLTTATSGVLTAVLDDDLAYVDASPTPSSVVGNTVTWNLPDLDFLGGGSVVLYTTVPPVPIGTRYPLVWTLASAGPEAYPEDNTVTVEVAAALEMYLPLISRSLE